MYPGSHGRRTLGGTGVLGPEARRGWLNRDGAPRNRRGPRAQEELARAGRRRRLVGVEAITPTRARSFAIPLRLLVRQPPLWAALAAFVGAALGPAGAFRLAAWLGGSHGSLHSLSLLALLVAPHGELLVALSLLGVLPLLGGDARAELP